MPTIDRKLKLLRGLLTGKTAFAGPFGVTVDVTRRCNLRCFGCPTHSPLVKDRKSFDPAAQDLDVDMFERLCRELQTMDTTTMAICGDGEPLLHPRVPDLIRLANDAGFRTVLLTNGTLLDEATARSLVENRLNQLRVSLWASSADEYELNYPGTDPGFFDRVVSGLRRVSAVKAAQKTSLPIVTVHRVISRHNVHGTDSFIDLALETGCNGVSFSPLHTVFGQLDSHGLSREEEELVRVKLLRAKKKLHSFDMEHNIDEAILRYKIGADFRQKFPCYIGWLNCRVKVDGTVRPCNACDWPAGNFRDQSFHEIWNGPAYQSFREELLLRDSAEASRRCDCTYCCFTGEILRVHRFYKWLSPLSHVLGSWGTS